MSHIALLLVRPMQPWEFYMGHAHCMAYFHKPPSLQIKHHTPQELSSGFYTRSVFQHSFHRTSAQHSCGLSRGDISTKRFKLGKQFQKEDHKEVPLLCGNTGQLAGTGLWGCYPLWDMVRGGAMALCPLGPHFHLSHSQAQPPSSVCVFNQCDSVWEGERYRRKKHGTPHSKGEISFFILGPTCLPHGVHHIFLCGRIL